MPGHCDNTQNLMRLREDLELMVRERQALRLSQCPYAIDPKDAFRLRTLDGQIFNTTARIRALQQRGHQQ